MTSIQIYQSSMSSRSSPAPQFETLKNDMKRLQDQVIGIYSDLVVFDVTLFLINAHVLWGTSLSVPLLFILVINTLSAYFRCKSIFLSHNKTIEILDSIFLCGYLLHLILYINNDVGYITESSIFIIIEFVFIIIVKVKDFLMN